MADCSGCPYHWHDSDCEYCSKKGDEVIDLKNYSTDTCSYYKEYVNSTGRKEYINSTSSNNHKNDDGAEHDGKSKWFEFIIGIIALIWLISRFI